MVLEIVTLLIVAAIMVVVMARRRRRRRVRKGFQAIPFSGSLALATLADDTVLLVDALSSALGEDYKTISMDCLWSLSNATGGEGPIFVGASHSDLSIVEVKEALTAEVTDPDDIIAVEHARRPVRKAGVFPVLGADAALNDGRSVRTRLGWSIGDGHNLSLFAMNRSGASLTTGALLKFQGTLYGHWQR